MTPRHGLPPAMCEGLTASVAGITLTLQGTDVTVTPPPPGRVVSFTETSSNAFAGLIHAFCTAAYMRALAGGEAK